MNKICVSHTISMGHRLPSYEGICSSPHGHNVTVEVEVTSPDFLDFKEVSDSLHRVLDGFDHAMVLYEKDDVLNFLRAQGFRTVSLSVEPTTEALATYFYNRMHEAYAGTMRVTVHETAKYAAIAESEDGRIYRNG